MHATKALQNGENPPEIYVSDGSMAERVGFEPTRAFTLPDFEFSPPLGTCENLSEDNRKYWKSPKAL